MIKSMKAYSKELVRIDERLSDINKFIRENKQTYKKDGDLSTRFNTTMSISLKKEKKLLKKRVLDIRRIMVLYI